MAPTDSGEEFWADLAKRQENLDPDGADAWAHENEEFDDEADNSSGFGKSNLQIDRSFDLSFAPTTTELADEEVPGGSASSPSEVSVDKKYPLSRKLRNRSFYRFTGPLANSTQCPQAPKR